MLVLKTFINGFEEKLDIPILIDDNLSMIYDKLFYTNKRWNKNFLSLKYPKNESSYELEKTLPDLNTPLLFVKRLYQNEEDFSTIYIDVLFNNISEYIGEGILNMYLIGEESEEYSKLYEEVNKKYINITKDELWEIVKITTGDILKKTYDLEIVDFKFNGNEYISIEEKTFIMETLNKYNIYDISTLTEEKFKGVIIRLTDIINQRIPGFRTELTIYLIKSKVKENKIILEEIYGGDIISELYRYKESLTKLHNKFINKKREMYNGLEEYHNYLKNVEIEDKQYDYSLIKLEVFYQKIDEMGSVLKSVTKNKLLNLVKIFNLFELTEEIPFITINNKYTNTLDPLSRIYNGTTATTKDIQEWIMVKNSQTKYRNIKGIQFRYKLENNSNTKKYINISINEYGRVYFILEGIDKIIGIKRDYKTFLKTIDKYINEIIEKINKIPQVIKNNSNNISRKFETISSKNYFLNIKTIDIRTKTDEYLHKQSLIKVLNNPYLSELLFTYKDTTSDVILSLFYNKFNKNSFGKGSLNEDASRNLTKSTFNTGIISYGIDDELELNGITITIRDNLYEKGSIIEIYNIQDIYQVDVIVSHLSSLINLTKKRVLLPTQLISDAPIVGIIRDAGGKISATKCQKNTQPFIIMKESDHLTRYPNIKMYKEMQKEYPDTYTINYEDIEYYCQHDEYPYPGFKPNGEICCYRKDQRGKAAYNNFLQPELYDTFVQPSNLLLKLSKTDENTGDIIFFNTYVLKAITNSDMRYYYLNEKNKLESIKDEKTIELLDTKDIWLQEVSLKELVTNPTKQYCPYIPNVYNKDITNNNKPCEKYSQKIFGYNPLNSRPCCFEKLQETVPYKAKDISSKITILDIITGELILQKNKLGELYEELNILFNTKLQTTVKYYRLGNVHGQYSIINSILTNLTNSTGSYTTKDTELNKALKNSVLFIEYIKKYLMKNRGLIYKLNNGLLIEKIFGKSNLIENEEYIINKYIGYLKNKRINLYDIVDIIQIILNIQIHILEISVDITDKAKIYNYNNIKIICKNSLITDNTSTLKNLILIKKDMFYESIVQLGISKNTGYSDVNGIFENKSAIMEFLINYYKESCVKIAEYPSLYKESYLILNDKDNVIEFYKKSSSLNIKGQIIDPGSDTIIYIWIEVKNTIYNFLLPVIQNSKSDDLNLVTYTLTDIIDTLLNKELLDINKLYELLSSNKGLYKIIGYTTKTILDDNYIDSVWTNYGVNIPVKTIKESELKHNITKMKHKFYKNVLENSNTESYKYIKEQLVIMDEYKKILIKIKTIYGTILSKEQFQKIKINLIEYLERSNIKFYKKYIYIKKFLYDIFNKNPKVFNVNLKDKDILDIIISYITKEIVEDIDRNLLNNIIIDDFNSIKEIMQRNTETIFTNYEDIYRWLENYRNTLKK
jgi:hypothetical protein